MKKIKLFPAEHVELRLHVSDEMIEDFKECKEIAEDSGFEKLKDCGSCSWCGTEIGNTAMCELVTKEQIL